MSMQSKFGRLAQPSLCLSKLVSDEPNVASAEVSYAGEAALPSSVLDGPGFVRLREVRKIIPVSRSGWYQGVADGVYPAPVSLGTGRAKAYRKSDIRALVARLEQGADHV